MAPVRRLRNFAWMKARKLPGVRCSTLKTECRSLLCLMIMPGRSWVAGIAIAESISFIAGCGGGGGKRQATVFPHGGLRVLFFMEVELFWDRAPPRSFLFVPSVRLECLWLHPKGQI